MKQLAYEEMLCFPLSVRVVPDVMPTLGGGQTVVGHQISEEGCQQSELFYSTRASEIRVWLVKQGYRRGRDLESCHMACEIDGIYHKANEAGY